MNTLDVLANIQNKEYKVTFLIDVLEKLKPKDYRIIDENSLIDASLNLERINIILKDNKVKDLQWF